MRLRASVIGQFCVAVTMVMGLSAADAAVQTQTETLNPTQPAFGPGVGNNPLVFNKFDPTQGTLNSVTLDMSYTSNRQVTITFTGPSAASVTTSSLSNPSQGGTISIGNPGATTSTAGSLLSATLPVLKYSVNDSTNTSGQTTVYSTTGAAGTLPLQAFNTSGAPVSSSQSGTASTTLTGAQLALFTGSGQVGLPVFATNPMTQTATDQTAKASVQTLDGVSLTLTYNYTPNAVPEPSSVALLGLGGGGILLVRRFRRRAVSADSPRA
jgi:hypothetical protein